MHLKLKMVSLAFFIEPTPKAGRLEDALRRRSIGYEIYGGVRFYDRKEVKDALAYVRLLVNPRSDVDYQRIINVPARGIEKRRLKRFGHSRSSTI